jgi:hypothetical protein
MTPMTDDAALLAITDRMIDLEVQIRQARALIWVDGHCWADDGDGFHRAESCLLCHVRAVLDDQPLPEAAP